MKSEEFIRLVIGKPWVNRACNFTGLDCWALIVLYYRHVLGIELHQVQGYEAGENFITCYESEIIFWKQLNYPKANCMAVFYRGEQPDHVGLMISPTKCLHSARSPGFVRSEAPLAVLKNYSKVEYFEYGAI